MNWPRYMIERRLRGGIIAYYWGHEPPISRQASRSVARPLGVTMARPSQGRPNSISIWMHGAPAAARPRILICSRASARWRG